MNNAVVHGTASLFADDCTNVQCNNPFSGNSVSIIQFKVNFHVKVNVTYRRSTSVVKSDALPDDAVGLYRMWSMC